MLPSIFSDTFSMSHRFARPFYEKDGAVVKMVGDKFHLFVNALGVRREDLKIDVEGTNHPSRHKLSISGSSRNEHLGEDFTFSFAVLTAKPLDEVKLESFESGILELSLTFKEPVAPDVRLSI